MMATGFIYILPLDDWLTGSYGFCLVCSYHSPERCLRPSYINICSKHYIHLVVRSESIKWFYRKIYVMEMEDFLIFFINKYCTLLILFTYTHKYTIGNDFVNRGNYI